MIHEFPANGWRPRPHQQALWDYFNDPISKKFDGTGKRASAIMHRRWGKDDVALNLMGKASITRPATYWHLLPEYAQGRKAIWAAVNPHTGKRRIDEAFPHEWRTNTNEQEMFIRFKWNATWQVVGSDNFKALVGTPPAGIVLSEWAKAHPAAWAYLAPILVENKGWALAITTPEGRNHAHAMHLSWDANPNYFAQVQTIEDSMRLCIAGGFEPTVTLEDVEIQRAEYRALFGDDAGDALIQQEYWCSFTAAILGAYYGKQIEAAERAGRICRLTPVNGYPINTAWDIGVDDPMAIWVFQAGPGWLHILDYIEGSNEGFDYYVNWLDERGYKGGVDWVPHDAKQREPGAPGARTRIQTLFSLRRNPRLVPDHKPIDRINAGRRLIPLAHFDEDRCDRGLEALRSYKQEWDQANRVFRKTPKHDHACFAGDTVILTRYGMRQIRDLPEAGEVLTPCGWKAYQNLGMIRTNAPLVQVTFEDGLMVRCTPDHLFLTDSGWRSAAYLTKGSLIRSCLTQSPSISMVDFIGCGLGRDIARAAGNEFTETFGVSLSERFRRVVTSITATITRLIMPSAIWSVCHLPTIYPRRGTAVNAQLGLRISISAMLRGRARALGINRKPADSGIVGWRKRRSPGRNGAGKISPVSLAAGLWRWLFELRATIRDFAQSTARPLRIASVRALAEREDVYDIEVPGVSCFSLSNGAVAHNSHGADAWGHLAVAVEFPMPIAQRPAPPPPNQITVNDLLKYTKPERKWA